MAKQSLGGQFDAWVREGAKDLHNAIVPAFPQSLHGVDEPGTPLNPTQQIVTESLEGSYDDFLARRQVDYSRDDERGMER